MPMRAQGQAPHHTSLRLMTWKMPIQLSSVNFFAHMILRCPPRAVAIRETRPHGLPPNGGQGQRIDYIALPVHFRTACAFSCVVETLDLGNARDDHFGVGVQLSWDDIVHNAKNPKDRSAQTRFDRAKIGLPQTNGLLDQVQPSPWSCDIQTHVNNFNQEVLGSLVRTCKPAHSKPKKPYISDETWAIRSAKLELRSRLKDSSKLHRLHLLRKILKAWKSEAPIGEDVMLADWHFQTTWYCSSIRLYVRFHQLGKRLRQCLRSERQRHLDQVLDALDANAATGEILHRLKPFIGPTSRKYMLAPCLWSASQMEASARPEKRLEIVGSHFLAKWKEVSRSAWMTNG